MVCLLQLSKDNHWLNNSFVSRIARGPWLKLWPVCVKGRPNCSVAQLVECSQGNREALGSSLGRDTIFSSPLTFGGSVWVRDFGNEHQKVHVSLFWADSGTNLIKQGKMSKKTKWLVSLVGRVFTR